MPPAPTGGRNGCSRSFFTRRTRSPCTTKRRKMSISMKNGQRMKSSSCPFTPVEGTAHFASFTHLTGYASNYYTYVLDKVIAIDFFAQFDKHNLLDGPAAMRYRHTVLEPGGSKPAAELVKDFLGRPQQMDALKAWMNQEFEQPPPASK